MARPNQHVNPNDDSPILADPSVQGWLSEFVNPSTQKYYKSSFRIFCEAMNVTPAELQKLNTKELKQLILCFQKLWIEKKAANNRTLSIITTVRSYLASVDVTLTFRKGQLLNAEVDNDSHVFSNGDLNRMWSVGGAFEKALLACAASQGWEISMFLEQQRERIQQKIEHADQNGLKFVFFRDKRDKTGKPRFCVLNPLAVECLKNYFAVRRDDDPRLFPITADGVQKLLVRLAKDANLKTTGSIRFHNVRKWLMSRLSRCGFNEFQIKFIMGKSISLSDAVYLQTLQSEIEDKYPLVYNDYLNICWKPQVSAGVVFSADEAADLKIILKAFRAGKLKWVE
jgi:integrase